MFKAIIRFIDRLSAGVTKCAMWLIFIFVIVTIIDVVLRYFFQAPTIWAREFVSLLFGPLWLLTGAYLLSTDEHVRMDLLFHRLSPRAKAITDLITFTLFFLYFFVIGYYAWQDWWAVYSMNEHSRSVWGPPLWPFKLWIPIGVSLLFLAGIAKYMRDLYTAITGRTWDGN